MNSSFRVFRAFRRPFFREMTTALIFAGLLLQSATAVAPDWWTTRGVLNPQAQADDYAVANLGQLKHMAQKAAQEMNDVLPGGAGTAINAMITTWTAPPAAGVTRDDYAALNLGQLKQVAKPFYDRLAITGMSDTGSYPWSGSGHAPDDYAVANLGQLKQVFSFDFTPVDADNDHDGLPDVWERLMFGNLNQNAMNDFDDDCLTNLEELHGGTLANVADSDGDGYYDGQEVAQNSDPLSNASVPNENAAHDEDPTMTEQPVALFEQRKAVINQWFSGYATSSIYWYDYTRSSAGYETYSGTTQCWQDKLSVVSYPVPHISPSPNYYDTGISAQALAELREYTGNDDDLVIGYANILHRRVGLYSDPTQARQPWLVSRNFFTYRKTLPAPNSGTIPPVFANVDVVRLEVPVGGTRPSTNANPATDGCLHLEPPPTQGYTLRDYVGSVTVTPMTDEGLALDNTGKDHWLTLPAGGNGVQVLLMTPVDFDDNLTYKRVGGDVTPSTSTGPAAGWFYYETYSGTAAGTASALHPALDDGTGNLAVATRPLLTFDVKDPKELYVTLRIIGSSIRATASPPSEADLKAYLDSVYVPQVNVHTHVKILPQVNVMFDVGLKQSYGNDNRGVGNKKLDILQGKFSDVAKVLKSDEETAILTAAPPDAEAAITIYWVACDSMDDYTWGDDPDVESAGNPNQLQPTPVLGTAGKAWDHFRIENDTRLRVIWVLGRDAAYYQGHRSSQAHTIAHELGHALGNLGHTVDTDGVPGGSTSPGGLGPWSGFSYYSDNNQRLMSGMPGPKRATGPKLLNKLERDKIHEFRKYAE